MKRIVLGIMLALSMMLTMQVSAEQVSNLNTDLWNAWSDTDRGGAINLPDAGYGGTYTVGWIQGADMPTASNNNIMGGWGWPDDPAARGVNFPRGYSWNGTHDSGWAGYVGFESLPNGNPLGIRDNDNWNGLGSAVAVIWKSGRSGLATFTFAVSATSIGSVFGIYDVRNGIWMGDDVVNANPDARLNVAIRASVTDAGTISAQQTISEGDEFIFACRSNTVPIDRIYWNQATVDVNPVPEPGSIIVLGVGLVGLVGMRRKKQ